MSRRAVTPAGKAGGTGQSRRVLLPTLGANGAGGSARASGTSAPRQGNRLTPAKPVKAFSVPGQGKKGVVLGPSGQLLKPAHPNPRLQTEVSNGAGTNRGGASGGGGGDGGGGDGGGEVPVGSRNWPPLDAPTVETPEFATCYAVCMLVGLVANGMLVNSLRNSFDETNRLTGLDRCAYDAEMAEYNGPCAIDGAVVRVCTEPGQRGTDAWVDAHSNFEFWLLLSPQIATALVNGGVFLAILGGLALVHWRVCGATPGGALVLLKCGGLAVNVVLIMLLLLMIFINTVKISKLTTAAFVTPTLPLSAPASEYVRGGHLPVAVANVESGDDVYGDVYPLLGCATFMQAVLFDFNNATACKQALLGGSFPADGSLLASSCIFAGGAKDEGDVIPDGSAICCVTAYAPPELQVDLVDKLNGIVSAYTATWAVNAGLNVVNMCATLSLIFVQ